MYGAAHDRQAGAHRLADRPAQAGAPVRDRDRHAEERARGPQGRRDRVGARTQGTRVEIEMEAIYKKGRRSVDDYIEQTALANPHVESALPARRRRTSSVYERVTQRAARRVEGDQAAPLRRRAGDPASHDEGHRPRATSRAMLSERLLARVSPAVARRDLPASPASAPTREPRRLSAAPGRAALPRDPDGQDHGAADGLPVADRRGAARQGARRRACRADFATAVTRPPAVYRGNPFQVEVGPRLRRRASRRRA